MYTLVRMRNLARDWRVSFERGNDRESACLFGRLYLWSVVDRQLLPSEVDVSWFGKQKDYGNPFDKESRNL